MGETSLGKKWEAKFREDWKKTFPNTFIYRLPDQLSGYKQTSQNPSDFICFANRKLYLIECKEHKGASIPFTAIPQYERLLSFKGFDQVFPGVLVWLSEKDIVFWVPIETLEQLVKDGKKSVGIKTIEEKLYNIIVIPAVKKRTFMESDFSIFATFGDEINE